MIGIKHDGRHTWQMYVTHLLLNTDTPSVEVGRQVAEEIYGEHNILRRTV